MSKLFKFTGIMALVAMMSVFAACEDDPSGGGDPAEIAGQTADVVDDVVTEFFDDNEALNSLEGLGGFISSITGSPNIVPFGLVEGDGWRSGRTAVRVHDALISSFREGDGGTIYERNIPAGLLGVTCIWDVQQSGYIGDPNDDGGAPDNGIRFRLYTIDSGTFLPVDPLEDIGYIDIIDLSSEPNIDVDIMANVGGATLLDYGLTGTFNSSANTFNIDMMGSVGNGADQLNFDWNASGTSTTFSNSFDVDLGPVSILFDQDYDAAIVSTTIQVTDAQSGADLELVLGLNEQTGNVEANSGIWFNGEQVAEFQGTDFQVDLVLSEGSPLSEADLIALFEVLFVLDDLFIALDELFFFALATTGGFFVS